MVGWKAWLDICRVAISGLFSTCEPRRKTKRGCLAVKPNSSSISRQNQGWLRVSGFMCLWLPFWHHWTASMFTWLVHHMKVPLSMPLHAKRCINDYVFFAIERYRKLRVFSNHVECIRKVLLVSLIVLPKRDCKEKFVTGFFTIKF